jgi:DNA-binding beta-propeller fold protein YncE
MISMRMSVVAAMIFAGVPVIMNAQTSARCDTPARDAITHVSIDGNPFTPVPSLDGCYIFVSTAQPNPRARPGVAVISRVGGKVTVLGKFPVRGSPTGAVLTHDGAILIVTTGGGVEFLDAANLVSGRGGPELGFMPIGNASETIFANISRDDHLLFVSEERAHAIAVIDLTKARKTRFSTGSVIGEIPTGNAPIALTFSSDEQYLYTTSQAAPEQLNWPEACVREGQDPKTAAPDHAQGAILVVDVARAGTDPEHSVVAAAPAGCNPVRLALSLDGKTLYATARGDNMLLGFDTAKLISDPAHAITGRVQVGTAPVGIAVFGEGKRIVVTNSNRFAQNANEPQWLSVIDAEKLSAGPAAVLGTIPAGAFPRELRVTADGKTLLATNFLSQTVEIVDLARLQLSPARK